FSESFQPCSALRPIVNSIVYRSPERPHVPRIGLPISGQSSIEQFGSTWHHFREECVHMKNQLGIVVGLSALMIGPAMAQQPNPNQAAAKALLQAADKAMGASYLKSWTASGTGWMGYPVQQFAQGDLPRTDLKTYTETIDLGSKSAKWEYTRVQGNNIGRGGGAGFPVQGEQAFQEFVNGATGWNVNAQGQAAPINPRDAGDRQLRLLLHPASFIQAALADNNAAVTDRYYARQNRTVKVVAFTTKVCDRPQPQCTRRVTGEFNNDNMLERVVTWF